MLQMCSNCCFFGLWYGDFSTFLTFRVLHSFAFAAFRKHSLQPSQHLPGANLVAGRHRRRRFPCLDSAAPSKNAGRRCWRDAASDRPCPSAAFAEHTMSEATDQVATSCAAATPLPYKERLGPQNPQP